MPLIQVNNKELYYTWSSPNKAQRHQSGLTLLFIHGLGSSSSFYATVIPTLLSAGFSCLALDTNGSGLSRFTNEQQSTASIAQDVSQVLSSLHIKADRTIVVGHSMGCIIASELACLRMLAGVVLIGAINPTPKYGEVFSKRIQIVQTQGMEAMADTIPMAATGSKSNSVHHAFIRALLLSQSPEGYVSLCRTIISAKTPYYSKINCPVLFIAGAEDQTATLSDTRDIMASLGTSASSVRLEILEAVGHWHCIEAAAEVGRLLVQFAQGERDVRSPESSKWHVSYT